MLGYTVQKAESSSERALMTLFFVAFGKFNRAFGPCSRAQQWCFWLVFPCLNHLSKIKQNVESLKCLQEF